MFDAIAHRVFRDHRLEENILDFHIVLLFLIHWKTHGRKAEIGSILLQFLIRGHMKVKPERQLNVNTDMVENVHCAISLMCWVAVLAATLLDNVLPN